MFNTLKKLPAQLFIASFLIILFGAKVINPDIASSQSTILNPAYSITCVKQTTTDPSVGFLTEAECITSIMQDQICTSTGAIGCVYDYEMLCQGSRWVTTGRLCGGDCLERDECISHGGIVGESCEDGKFLCSGAKIDSRCPEGENAFYDSEGNMVCKNSSKFQCDKDDLAACNFKPWLCHCSGGNACTGTYCEDPATDDDPYDIRDVCIGAGRSYCVNYQGFGMTCCEEGYSCRDDADGCFKDDTPPSSPNPSNPPPPSPTPTLPPGPQCLDITMNNPAAEIGDQTTFTCGTVAGADHYIFRVINPDSTATQLNATGRISEAFSITESGTYYAQCQICTGANDSTCLPWETLP